jgi:hypothetical protein
MIPKEKAQELINKYSEHSYISLTNNPTTSYHKKQCALICVDEILSLFIQNQFDSKFYYYQQVKEEINKL